MFIYSKERGHITTSEKDKYWYIKVCCLFGSTFNNQTPHSLCLTYNPAIIRWGNQEVPSLTQVPPVIGFEL